jgi:hypothetical protein
MSEQETTRKRVAYGNDEKPKDEKEDAKNSSQEDYQHHNN